jgi:signal transduction histidine kinase
VSPLDALRPGEGPRSFRARLFAILIAFALVPAAVLTLAFGGITAALVPLVGASAPWDSVAATGDRALAAARSAPLTAAQRAALDRHAQELAESVTQARRVQFLAGRIAPLVALGTVLGLALLAYGASRVAGHLSRQLSRPLDELVLWTRRIAAGKALPSRAVGRGAPEFAVLRDGMRAMAAELEASRAEALEAERLRALRDSARQVAHELKNPLTPMRLAVARLERSAPPDVADAVAVLATETRRLETLARHFSQFGRLPEGPMAPVEMGDLVRYAVRAVVPPEWPVVLDIADPLPVVQGQYDALARALQNILLNAVEASRDVTAPTVAVRAAPTPDGGLRITVRDAGPGIAVERLADLWEPYVTSKPAGTGLGLAIVRQTILAHGGRVLAANIPGGGAEIGFELPPPAPGATSLRSAP